MSLITVTYGARSLKVKTSPGMLLNEVLTRGCSHFGVDSDSWTLKHGKSTLDLSLPLRLSGLSAGSKVELVKKQGGSTEAHQVTLKLQVLDSSFQAPSDPKLLIQKFSTSTSVISALQHFETVAGIDLLDRTSVENDPKRGTQTTRRLKPVVQSFSKTLATKEELDKPLSELGLSGNALLRVKFEVVEEQVKQTAVVPDVPAETPSSVQAAVERPIETPVETPAQKAALNDEPDASQDDPMGEAPSEVAPKEEPKVEVFLPAPQSIETVTDDSIYELSVSQAKKYQAMLAKKAGSGTMMTRRMREENAPVKREVTSCVIRIRFPDLTNLQIVLRPEQTLGDLYNLLLDKFLVPLSEPGPDGMLFHLTSSHPHRVLNQSSGDFEKQLCKHFDFGDRTLLVFEGLNPAKKTYLRDEYLGSAKPITDAPEVQLDLHRNEMEDLEDDIIPAKPTLPEPPSSATRFQSSKSDKKLPKWLKFK